MIWGDNILVPVYLFNTLNETLSARVSIVDYTDAALDPVLEPQGNSILPLEPLTSQKTRLRLKALNYTNAEQLPPAFIQVRGVATQDSIRY